MHVYINYLHIHMYTRIYIYIYATPPCAYIFLSLQEDTYKKQTFLGRKIGKLENWKNGKLGPEIGKLENWENGKLGPENWKIGKWKVMPRKI